MQSTQLQPTKPTLSLMARALLSAGLMSVSLAMSQANAAEITQAAEQTETLPEVAVKAEKALDAHDLPPAYVGGQVATGGGLGLLGNRDFMDTPFNITNYTAQTIEDQQARSLSDVLIADPSVRLSSARTNINEDFSIRGFPVPSQDIALNGMYGLSPYFRVPVEAAERVEVLKGPSALLNGMAPSGSVGGAINLVPKRAGSEPMMRVTGSYLSDSVYGGHADIGRRFGENQEFGIRFNGAYRRGDTEIDRQGLEEAVGALGLDYSGERLRLSADIIYQQQNIDRVVRQFSVAAGVTDIPRAADGDLNYPGYGFLDMQDFSAAVRGEFDINDYITVYGGFGERDSRMDAVAGNPAITSSTGDFASAPAWQVFDISSHSAEAGVRGRFATGSVGHEINFGVTRLVQNSDIYFVPAGAFRTSNLYNPVYSEASRPNLSGHPLKYTTSELTSVALADTLSFAEDRVQLTLGARHQKVEAQSYGINTGVAEGENYDEGEVTPAVGLVVKPWKNVSLYANYIEGLSQGPTAPIGSVNAGEMFAPFITKQKEAGIKVDSGMLATTLSLFEIERPSGVINPGGSFDVDGEQRNRGVELNVFGQVVDHVRLLGGLAYTDGKLTETQGGAFDDNYAVAVPKVQVNLGAEWDTLFVRGLTLNARAIYTSKQYVDQANTLSLPQSTRIDIGARYSTVLNDTPVVFRANVENLFDKAYWGSSNSGFLYLGAPRTLLVSATVDF